MKTKTNHKTVIFFGGFHSMPAIRLRVATTDDELTLMLSTNQARKLTRHFCGIRTCTCGGPWRASSSLDGTDIQILWPWPR